MGCGKSRALNNSISGFPPLVIRDIPGTNSEMAGKYISLFWGH